MEWPSTPVESVPPERFVPEHCPWAECRGHEPHPGRPFRFHRHGVFLRKGDGRVVPRFRCLGCRRTFSQQSFAFSYYLKRPDLSVAVAAGLNAGSAHRQLARSLGCSPSTVTRRAGKLGRHSLLLSARALEHVVLNEPVVVDHFESFEFSQDFPVGIATSVGQDSWFVYDLEAAPHRRSGRTTAAQRERLKRRKLPPRGAFRRSFRHALDRLLDLAPGSGAVRVVTDDHPAYRAALQDHPRRRRVRHRRFPNPKRGPKGSPRTAEAILRDREMFAADLLHRLMRHTCAHHRRETIAFGRRINALMERGFVLTVWRNFVKRRSERRPNEPTPAMRIRLAESPWDWRQVLARRLFASKVGVPEAWMKIYRRDWITPVVGRNERHRLVNAY